MLAPFGLWQSNNWSVGRAPLACLTAFLPAQALSSHPQQRQACRGAGSLQKGRGRPRGPGARVTPQPGRAPSCRRALLVPYFFMAVLVLGCDEMASQLEDAFAHIPCKDILDVGVRDIAK